MTASLPLLLLDVDGVLNPFAAPACPPGYSEHDFFPGEEPVRVCAGHGSWLRELAARFQIVWATAWGTDASVDAAQGLTRPAIDQALQWAESQATE